MHKTALCVWLILLRRISAHNYYTILSTDSYIGPCDGEESKWNSIIDFSKCTYDIDMNGEEKFSGYLTYKGGFDAGKLALKIDVFRKNRGVWVPTVFEIFRPDFCAVFLLETELWYTMTKSFSKEAGCPFSKNVQYPVNGSGNYKIKDVPKGNLEGEYKAVVRLYNKDTEFCCVVQRQVLRDK